MQFIVCQLNCKIKRLFLNNVPRDGERGTGVGAETDRKEGGGREEELRPPNTAASHRNTRSSLCPGGRLATLTTAAHPLATGSLEKGHHLHVAEASLGAMPSQSFQDESAQAWPPQNHVPPTGSFDKQWWSPTASPKQQDRTARLAGLGTDTALGLLPALL